MSGKREQYEEASHSLIKKRCFEVDGVVHQNPAIPLTTCNDTEAALLFIKRILLQENPKYSFPPVIFVHQLYDVIGNKTTVNRQIEILRNEKKIILIHMGNEENMKVVVFFEDLKNHLLKDRNMGEVLLYNKFFDKVLQNTTDFGISRTDLLIKYKFSEKDVRALVNAGLLILRETGVFWFSFPSAGIFMKKLIKGRHMIVAVVRKRKFREILLTELEKMPFKKQLELPIRYHIHDIVGGNYIKCFQTSSGRLLQSVS